MSNLVQRSVAVTLKPLVRQLPNRYGYARKVKEALAARGITVSQEMVYQTVFGNRHHPEITRELIQLVKAYKQAQQELTAQINALVED